MSAVYNQELSDEQIIHGLRNLVGYVENGTDAVIKIYQDDATKEFCVSIGRHCYVYDKSFRGCLIKAIKEHGDDYLK